MHPQSHDEGVEAAGIALPLPRSFRRRWCEERPKENRWHAAELDTNPMGRAGLLKGMQERAPITEKYIVGPGEMMCRGMPEGMVAPNRIVLPGIF